MARATSRMTALAAALAASTVLCAQPEPTPQPPAEPDTPAAPAVTPDTPPEARLKTDPGGIAPDERTPWAFRSIALYWDNDGTYTKPWNESDRHYTNGAKIDLAWDPDLPDRLDDLVRPAGSDFADADLALGLVFVQHIYTATDIRLTDPPEGDHPYSGWLYAGVYLQRAGEYVHDHAELDLGVAGRGSMAESTQKFVHSVFPDQNRPSGWDTQLSSEFAFNIRLARTWRTPTLDLAGLDLQLLPRVSADLGNVFIRGHADVTLRLGLHLPDDFGPGRLLDFRDATGSWSSDHDFGFYLFGRAGGRLVARDLFIEGNTFQDSRGADLEHIVGELEVGLRLRWRSIEAGYSITWITEQFKAQDHPDSFGNWQLTFYF